MNMSVRWMTISVAILSSAVCAIAQEWNIEGVEAGTKPELVLDAEGCPHIAYMTEQLAGGVFYAFKEGNEWVIDTVAEGYFYGPLDIALDAEGDPHIVYHDHQDASSDPSQGDAGYAFRQSDRWNVETISDEGHDGWDPSVAIGPDGEVYVSSIDPSQFGSENGVEWAVRRGDVWFVNEVGSGPIPYEFGTQLQFDTFGQLHLVFHDGSERLNTGGGSDLFYGLLVDGQWQLEVADDEGDVGKFSSLAVDADGLPHIAYFEWATSNTGFIKYAHWDGSQWQRERVEELRDVEISFLGARRMTSIALDARGIPHIAYSDRNAVRYAVWNGSGWDRQDVAFASTGQILGQLVSLALDAESRPHIAFYELPERPSSSLGEVFYAVGQRPTAVIEEQALPLLSTLHGNFPNPFNASTVLRYELAQTAEVDLAVYSLIGQRVRTLVLGRVGAGLYQVPWDGVDGQGKAVASGLYFARLYADGQEMIGKMLLLR
ncbi:MAG: hypothetical protein ACI8P2_000583 [Candidatus Latescibacterota bacterium]|jgi:hypothetical protein